MTSIFAGLLQTAIIDNAAGINNHLLQTATTAETASAINSLNRRSSAMFNTITSSTAAVNNADNQQPLTVLTVSDLAQGLYLDNYVWQLFRSKMVIFLLLCHINWSINSAIIIWLVWLRTRLDDGFGRNGLTVLMILLALAASNYPLLQLLLPFELIRWSAITYKSWLPALQYQLRLPLSWLPADISLLLSQLANTQLLLSRHGWLLLVARQRIICYSYQHGLRSLADKLVTAADEQATVIANGSTATNTNANSSRNNSYSWLPTLFSSVNAVTDGQTSTAVVKPTTLHCLLCQIDVSDYRYKLTCYDDNGDNNHSLCTSCYYQQLLLYADSHNIPCPSCSHQ